MGKSSKRQEWIHELEEINQTIQVENVELRRLWKTSKEEKHAMQNKFQYMKERFQAVKLELKDKDEMLVRF